MGVYYPQASCTLRILWEDFNFKSDAKLQEVYSFGIMAKSVNVYINDYTQADTFSIEVDYKNFPFDPRLIRAAGVTIHMADMKQIFNGDNSLRSLERTTDNTVFVGFADEESISFDTSKRTVKFEGRDLTALLIDRKYTGGPLAMTQTVDQVLQGLLGDLKETSKSAADPTKGLTLDIRGLKAADLPVLSQFWEANHQLSGQKNVDRHETYWEAVQDVVARAGLIAYVELDKLVLTKPRALYDATQAKVFVYGMNVSNLQMKRKIGRKKNFNVVVRSLAGKEVVEAKIPLEGTLEWSKSSGIPLGEVKLPEIGPDGHQVPPEQWKPAPYSSFRVPNCKSKDQLIKYAESIYEEIGRQQIEGSFDTRDMETSTLSKTCFDMLKLRNGTPIQIQLDQGDLEGISTIKSETLRAQYLMSRGYEQSIAQAFASSFNKFANVFYTKAVRFTLDNDNGFKAAIEFINFIDTKFQPPTS